MDYTTLFLLAFAFFFTLAMTKASISRLVKFRIISTDLHKEKKPKKPKLGGIAIAAGFSMSIILAYLLYESVIFLVVLLAFLISAAIGLLDDLFKFGEMAKLTLPALAAIPLLYFVRWEVLAIVALFLAVAVLSNWTNMLAGFNGLETGLACIALFFIALASPSNVSIIFLIYLASLLAFLFFNKYPAKVFPGDVGTLPIGTMFVAAFLLGVPLHIIFILIIPYLADACLKFFSAGIFSSSSFGPTQVKGSYLVPQERYLSLSTVIMKTRSIKEWQLVLSIWTIEIALGVVTLLV